MTRGLDNITQQKLEQLFEMAGGYVLDFSNARYAAFVENCLGFDPYERYRGSKAVILRQIWSGEPSGEVARLNAELLEYWRVNKLATGQEPTRFEQEVYTELLGFFRQETAPAVSPADLAFLDKDFASLDLGALPSELTSAKIVDARLSEIERCVDADAPLAVIFLVGSTLEGLLMDMALAHPDQYTASTSAPRKAGEIKPIPSWTQARRSCPRVPQLHPPAATTCRELRASCGDRADRSPSPSCSLGRSSSPERQPRPGWLRVRGSGIASPPLWARRGSNPRPPRCKRGALAI